MALSLIWGGSFFFIKILLEDFGPLGIAFMRAVFGFLFITAFMLVMRKPFGLRQIPWVPALSIAIVNMSMPWALIAYSETRLASSLASVLNATTPLWTMLVGLLFFGAVFTRVQWAGMSVAFIGIVVLIGLTPNATMSVDLYGAILMIFATLCYAVGSQLTKRFLNGLSVYQMTFSSLLGGMLGSGLLAFSLEEVPLQAVFRLPAFGSLIGLGLLGSGVAYILFNHILRNGSPELATSVTYLIPATAMIWGYTLLDEPIGWNLGAGLVLILGGVFLASRNIGRDKLGQKQA
nr:EamA family transporter [Paenibacillus phyllosphaerae]